MTTDADMLGIQRSLLGGRYVFGAKDPGPHGRSDCSGYSSGCMREGGLPFPDGSYEQQDYCAAHGLYWPGLAGIQKARMFPGLGVIFRRAGALIGGKVDPIGHVILIDNPNLSDEYASTALGSGHWPIVGRPFTGGGFLPGVVPQFTNPIIQPPGADVSMKLLVSSGANSGPVDPATPFESFVLYDSGIRLPLNQHDFTLLKDFYKTEVDVMDQPNFDFFKRISALGSPT